MRTPRPSDRFRDPLTGMLPPIAGGSPEADTAYPLDPASVSGTQITVDQYVNMPTLITRTILQLASQDFYAHRIFRPGPAVEGGAILFERPNPLLTDLYAGRRTQVMDPMTEAPVLTFLRGVPMVTTPRKIGGKWPVGKEERRRNRVDIVDKAIVQTANTISRDLEIMALSAVTAVIAAESRTIAGQSWSAAAEEEEAKVTQSSLPLTDFLNVKKTIELEERGHNLNGAIFHPDQWTSLATIYGARDVSNALDSVGITETAVSPRQPAGRVKLYEAGGVGVWSTEFPLQQKTWIEEETDETFWYQWTVSPAFAITDQFAMAELTGVA